MVSRRLYCSLPAALLMACGGAKTTTGIDAGASMDASATVQDAAQASSDAGAAPGDSGVVPVDASGGGDPVSAVFRTAAFQVEVSADLVYAQGLTHSAWGAGGGTPVDLLLDVYRPTRTDDARMPAVVMIHGGGFKGGTHKHQALSRMARWFAERGWVAFSIDYRVVRHAGTLPAIYPAAPAQATADQADQWHALYPACRDAKAAIRWVRAHAETYSLHPDYITAVGGSAGSFIAMALGVSDEGDCKNEIPAAADPTLADTHLDQSSAVATIIDHWGGPAILTMLEAMSGADRFDPTDAPVSIVHGTDDPTVAFSEAEAIKAEYDVTGVPYAWHPLQGVGHAAWNATINGQSLAESAARFVIAQQGLELR